jgi:hypothetical protein
MTRCRDGRRSHDVIGAARQCLIVSHQHRVDPRRLCQPSGFDDLHAVAESGCRWARRQTVLDRRVARASDALLLAADSWTG